MINVINRELVVPNNERYIGTSYDIDSENRIFRVPRVTAGGVDLANMTFMLDLQYTVGEKDSAVLDKEVTDDIINLVWTISSGQLQHPGTVFIQLRALDTEGSVKWTSYKAALYTEDCINTSGEYTGSLSELEYYETHYRLWEAEEKHRELAEHDRQRLYNSMRSFFEDPGLDADAELAAQMIDRAAEIKADLDDATTKHESDIGTIYETIENINDTISGIQADIDQVAIPITYHATDWEEYDGGFYTQTIENESINNIDYQLTDMKSVDMSFDDVKAYNKAFGILSSGTHVTNNGSVTSRVMKPITSDITVILRR